MMEPQGLIFDCDGTLADSMPIHWRAWEQTCNRHGLKFTEERHYALGGTPSRIIFEILGKEQGVELDPLALSQEKEAAYLLLMPEVKPVEPVLAIAREHRSKLPMAVATGGQRGCITQLLEHLGIADWFDALVTSDDIENPKPAPDTFLLAAKHIGVAPENCRAFEDTDLGMQAIRAAGMEAVDVRKIPGVLPGQEEEA